jgi:bifunctional DNase/RNase
MGGSTMIVMQLREVTACAIHGRAIIRLEDVHERLRLTFYADLEEAQRLAHVIERGPYATQPVYDFMQSLLAACQITATRVVLDEVQGERIGSYISCQRATSEVVVPCYAPDALALALRANLPIYATAAALAHAEHLSCSPSPLDARGEMTQWLAQVKPEDFSSRLEEEAG